jgi:tRNA (cmo5U34)-methyltransferase
MGNQWHLDPASYMEVVRAEIPDYDELESALAEATADVAARSILDLGSGTGTTARCVLARHPEAHLVGVDQSPEMLDEAMKLLPAAEFIVALLEDPLPVGPFDLVVSAFAVHHLDGSAKRDLFARIADVLSPGGRFALLDVVIPETPPARCVPLEEGIDVPSSARDQLAWLAEAGLRPGTVLDKDDLCILTGDR